jgi:hypothetical protein
MTYIWNRAEKVDNKFMPERVTNSFDDWKDDVQRGFKYSSESKRKIAQYRIIRERNKMNENLNKLGYESHYG